MMNYKEERPFPESDTINLNFTASVDESVDHTHDGSENHTHDPETGDEIPNA